MFVTRLYPLFDSCQEDNSKVLMLQKQAAQLTSDLEEAKRIKDKQDDLVLILQEVCVPRLLCMLFSHLLMDISLNTVVSYSYSTIESAFCRLLLIVGHLVDSLRWVTIPLLRWVVFIFSIIAFKIFLFSYKTKPHRWQIVEMTNMMQNLYIFFIIYMMSRNLMKKKLRNLLK
jgi:hypothetical protein